MDSRTTTAPEVDDDWELCDDEGFVYKRKKRRLELAAGSSPVVNPAPNHKVEVRRKRERRRTILLQLCSKYQGEIDQWEHLSNMLRAMEENVRRVREQQERREDAREGEPAGSFDGSVSDGTWGHHSACWSLLNELLSQVEAQEMIGHDISNLCDIAEAICNAQEERFKQSLLDLPIWASPHELMSSLCDEGLPG